MGRRATVSARLTDELAGDIAKNPHKYPEFSWDNSITGLGIRRYPSGKVSWVVKKPRLKVLGPVGELTEIEARIKALEIIKDGVSENSERASKVVDSGRHLTVDYCFRKAIRSPKFLEGRTLKTQTTVSSYLGAIGKRLPVLKNKPFAQLSTADLIDIKLAFDDLGASSKNNILLAVKQVWDFYRFHDPEVQRIVGDLPAMSLAGLKESRSPRRDRLSPEQLRVVYHASDLLENPYQTAFIKLAILSGRRNSTITHMRWQDINLDQRVWIIPSEFNRKGRGQTQGREEWLPLTDLMIDVIEAVPETGPYVMGGNAPITAGSKLLEKIKRLSEISADDRGQSWTYHGFRRSMASSAMGAVDKRTIDLIQGRVESGAAAHYYQGEYLESKRDGLKQWEILVLDAPRGSNNSAVRQPHVNPAFVVAVYLWASSYINEFGCSPGEVRDKALQQFGFARSTFYKYMDLGEEAVNQLPAMRHYAELKPSLEALEKTIKTGSKDLLHQMYHQSEVAIEMNRERKRVAARMERDVKRSAR